MNGFIENLDGRFAIRWYHAARKKFDDQFNPEPFTSPPEIPVTGLGGFIKG